MAKAIYHKHQRVYVYPVGTWALIEQVKPQWVKDVEEPVRVFYDCGLGRDFTADELATEQVESLDAGHWRVLRAKNKWQSAEECARHPFPGTFPVIVTESMDWGGWRVPAAEYDRDPNRIEAQARLMANAPSLLAVAETLVELAREDADVSPAVAELSRTAADILKQVNTKPSGKHGSNSQQAA
ncbi:MAG: hypothetical protein CMF75_03190 [Maricaulis sp.]|nr:hypothetical protein [Maricaulis sp.]